MEAEIGYLKIGILLGQKGFEVSDIIDLGDAKHIIEDAFHVEVTNGDYLEDILIKMQEEK